MRDKNKRRLTRVKGYIRLYAMVIPFIWYLLFYKDSDRLKMWSNFEKSEIS
jgi:hypothetical protein